MVHRFVMIFGGLLFLYFFAKAIPNSFRSYSLRKQELEIEKKRLEVEKLRLELEQRKLDRRNNNNKE